MKFPPMTEEQIKENDFKLLPDGMYDYTVIHAEEKISKTGNEYIALKLQIWDEQGRERLVFTNLALIKLLKHFCDTNGLQTQYESGEVIAQECMNHSGKCVIGTEKGKLKEGSTTDYYKDKNIVLDYVQGKPSTTMPLTATKQFDDDIPF
ncbi:MAG TPA: DUF669 domain-containing protein [Saprospiraceae bacterium]|nr:DUF669 domain-containing protein [Saprospiraceae bacterium]